MREFYPFILTLHITAGVTSLLTLLPPLLARKGGRWHRRAGWAFVVAMAVTAASGLVVSGLWMTMPLVVKPPSRPLTDAELRAVASSMQEFGCFLAYLGVLIASALWNGLRVLLVRRKRAEHGALADRAVAAFVLATGLTLTLAGLLRGNILMLAFGALGSHGAWNDLRYLGSPQRERDAWLMRHIDSMIGAAIAAVTAFSVFNANRLLGAAIPPSLEFLPWVLPTLVGVPAAAVFKARYRRRRAS